ncbi:MAG: EamA family transporter [Steroidobacteraceae bacterium]
MSAESPSRPTLILCLLTVWLVWGSSYLATRIGVSHLPPFLFGGIRFLVSGVLLLGFSSWRGTFDPAVLRTDWRHVVVLGVLGIAFVNGLQSWAMQWVTSQGGALLNASCAFWIVVFGLFGRRAHRPSALALTGIVIGFFGTALLVWPEGGTAAQPIGPQLTILLACLGWSVATIYLRNVDVRLDVFALTGAQMVVGGAVLVAIGAATGEFARFTASPAGLIAMAWQTLFSSCCAYTAYTWLAQNASPAQTGTYGYVNPLIAAGLGYLVLDERMSTLQLIGSATVVVGVVAINWPTSVTMRRSPKAI